MFPNWLGGEELEGATGIDVELRREGTLVLAPTAEQSRIIWNSVSRAQGIQGVLQHRKLLYPCHGTDRQRMCLQPQGAGRSHWVNVSLLPPCRFVSTAMQLAMMAAAKRHCVLVADLATECRPLDKAQMMRV